jgi:glucan 1,3-beta-glucosidase
MLFTKAIAAALAVETALAAVIPKRADFSYGNIPVRGANVGGWLVLEPWITPSIFQQFTDGSVVDEYTLGQKSDAESILKAHWDSWVSLADFQKLADNGFNLVRIPIGYWAFEKFEQDTYVQGAQPYLDTAIGWARQTGLKVWIDLHGAPLSQNGFDNSGQRTSTPNWSTGDSIAFTENIMTTIAKKYQSSDYADVIAGIELLNEPLMSALPGGRDATQGYYQDGFDIVRAAGDSYVIIQDGFDNPNSWNGFLTGSGTSGAILDHHEYQVFTNELVALTPEEHVSAVASSAEGWATGQDKFLICGEWTAAMTDCAAALNGYGIGARYDGSYSKQNSDGSYDTSSYVGSCGSINYIDEWSDYNKTSTTNYINAQISTFESMAQGWIFWTMKTEASAEWDLFRLIDAGVWPKLS